jgi:hypothetical protein
MFLAVWSPRTLLATAWMIVPTLFLGSEEGGIVAMMNRLVKKRGERRRGGDHICCGQALSRHLFFDILF